MKCFVVAIFNSIFVFVDVVLTQVVDVGRGGGVAYIILAADVAGVAVIINTRRWRRKIGGRKVFVWHGVLAGVVESMKKTRRK